MAHVPPGESDVLDDGCGVALICGDGPTGLTCSPDLHRCALDENAR